jgi:hypothetical protein
MKKTNCLTRALSYLFFIFACNFQKFFPNEKTHSIPASVPIDAKRNCTGGFRKSFLFGGHSGVICKFQN